MTLENKVAIVTGAGRGMGKAISIQFAQQGIHVALAEIDAPALEDASSAMKGLAGRGILIQADVGNLAEIDRVVKETLDAFGRIDILVNNAAVARVMDVMETTEEDWDRIHRVNAKGAFFFMQRVASELIRQGEGGRIINISSVAGKGYSGTSSAAYAASKGAVIAMTQIAAHQLGRYNINVNAICPGATETPMSEASMVTRSQKLGVSVEELKERRKKTIPIGRPNDPEDIADMVLFLAGPGARNITGQSINVDGGLVMH